MKEEYMSSNSEKRFLCEEYAREQWGPLVSKANEEVRLAKQQLKIFEEENDRLKADAAHGRALMKMIKAIEENPAAKAFWDKTMAMIRLVE